MRRVWLACFVIAAAWLATLATLAVVARNDDPPKPGPSPDTTTIVATEQLDGLNLGGWLLIIGLPAAIVVVSTAYVRKRRYFAKPH